ncbi:alpha/beta fold hydrolase [Streptomyces lichenis]|uniref:Alpha/beta fold hydrolase n=1 Tax=Streptomyces lichenis TaxID=2306967 RepID=A0ABT0IH17_9ACTN|nr:alpha/beta fold hydrolase [Streptomyces lichenis]MCK8680618.1 alpha/beta fold hydrolase [Streptomyces lichenis]
MVMVRAGGLLHHVARLGPEDAPGAPPVAVFLHGAFIDTLASFYFTLAPAFAAHGWDTVMYDLRGHGRSERPPSGYRVEDFTADLDALLDALGLTEPVHLVGNSFGATLAFDFAVHHPDRVASLTAVEGCPAGSGWAEAMAGALHRATETLPEDQALAWFTEQYGTVSSTRTGDPVHDARIARLGRNAGRLIRATTITRDIPRSRRPTADQLAALSCPVLLVNGEHGLVATESAHLTAVLPHCRRVIVPGHKHSVLVEAPTEVTALTLDWLDEHTHTHPTPTTPSSARPASTVPNAAHPATVPGEARPGSTVPDAAYPAGTTPGSAHPAGTTPHAAHPASTLPHAAHPVTGTAR